MSLARRISTAISGEVNYDEPPPRPRHMRWAPVLPLLIALTGFALHVRGYRDWSEFICITALVLSMILFPFGPLRQPRSDYPLDEREKLLHYRSLLAGANSVAMLAIFGALVAGGIHGESIWKPATREDWRIIFYILLTVLVTISVLHASWTTRPIKEEE